MSRRMRVTTIHLYTSEHYRILPDHADVMVALTKSGETTFESKTRRTGARMTRVIRSWHYATDDRHGTSNSSKLNLQ